MSLFKSLADSPRDIRENFTVLHAYFVLHEVREYPRHTAVRDEVGNYGKLFIGIHGSAAGVAAMGMEKIDFIWYLKRISFLAAIGYLGGAAVYLAQYELFH